MDKRKFLNFLFPNTNIYVLVLFLFILVTLFLNFWVAIIEFFAFFGVLYYNTKVKNKKTEEILKYIENLTLNLDSVTKDSILHFPLPMVVVQLNGRISWYNQSFGDIMANNELFEAQIQTIIPDFQISKIASSGDNINLNIEYENKFYNVIGNIAKINEKTDVNYLIVLFFIDVTDHNILKSKYTNEKSVEGIIIIDNYEELVANTPDISRPQLFAEIDKVISDWANVSNGVLKRFQRDKYLFLFENQYLNSLISTKFDIMEKIKEIQAGNKIPVTLSIGIGKDGNNILENDSFANAAIDMALGRGGDQTVIKDQTQFSFYGGKSREVERRTRVKARVMAYAIRELIINSSKVLIMGHQNPDIDSIGASIGLYRAIISRGKSANIVVGDQNYSATLLINKFLSDKDYEDAFISKQEAIDTTTKNTLIIVVDTHKPSIVEVPTLLNQTNQIIVIDHHRRGADFIDNAVLVYHEPYASSTCELVTELIQYMGDDVTLNPNEAEALYSGIVMDTKNFTFKTGVRTFEAASYLRKIGVDTISVKRLFRSDLDFYIEKSEIIKNAEIYNDTIAISEYDKKHNEINVLMAQAADELVNIDGIEASFVLCQIAESVYISGRSLGFVNVQEILEQLGGGGHLTLAGAQIADKTLKEARIMLKDAIDKYYEKNN